MNRENQIKTDVAIPRGESTQFFADPTVAESILNLVKTRENSLRSVVGPTPFVPDYGGSRYGQGSIPSYSTMHGIGYFEDKYGHPHILIHTGSELRHFQGWAQGYADLIGNTGQYTDSLPDDSRAKSPTQFIPVPGGIVIVPNDFRAFFFDGELIAPLGYDRVPAAPVLQGPQKTLGTGSDIWDRGYCRYTKTLNTSISGDDHDVFGICQLGNITYDSASGGTNTDYAISHAASFQGAIQWLDHWGNVSPLSPRSGTCTVPTAKLRVMNTGNAENRPDDLRYQLLWQDIAPGEHATIGTILCRTRDLKSSGSYSLYEITNRSGIFPHATLPGTACEMYPDNNPDADLLAEPLDVIPVPRFKYGGYAFGRLWIGNSDLFPNRIWGSYPGRFGTFPTEPNLTFDLPYPVMGILSTPWGALVTTTRTVHLLVENPDSGRYQLVGLSQTIGNAAPSSLCLTSFGAVWLSANGFAAFDGEKVTLVSDEIQRDMPAIHISRKIRSNAYFDPDAGVYRCFVPYESESCQTAFEFDGATWRRLQMVTDSASCVWAGRYALVAGQATDSNATAHHGVWVIERETPQFTPEARTHRVETPWIRPFNDERGSLQSVYLFLRETIRDDSALLTITAWRDGRKNAAETKTVRLYRTETAPPSWDISGLTYGSTDLWWIRRRGFWVRADIPLPSAESVKLAFSTPSPVEFIGYRLVFDPKGSGRTPR